MINRNLPAPLVTRRELMGGSVLGATLLTASAVPLVAQAKRAGGRIIDSHVHLWQLPRSGPPMSDNATFPGASAPWMQVNRMPRDYDARVGGPKVDMLVLIESS